MNLEPRVRVRTNYKVKGRDRIRYIGSFKNIVRDINNAIGKV